MALEAMTQGAINTDINILLHKIHHGALAVVSDQWIARNS